MDHFNGLDERDSSSSSGEHSSPMSDLSLTKDQRSIWTDDAFPFLVQDSSHLGLTADFWNSNLEHDKPNKTEENTLENSAFTMPKEINLNSFISNSQLDGNRPEAEEEHASSLNYRVKREVLEPNTIADLATLKTHSQNLVAKEPIIAAHHIPAINSDSGKPIYLLPLGVPKVGAKSRVETQIKVSLVLVTPTVPLPENTNPVERWIAADGGLSAQATQELSRVSSFTHLRLPELLALKKKKPAKKTSKTEADPASTLNLSVAVLRGTEPHSEIFICPGCQQRELKRSQRKKDTRVKPEANDWTSPDGQIERQRVVVFNCSQVVEFTGGEVVLPTRITCYCRHHKEKRGFCIAFTLTTNAGVVVARAITSPIMITDDHKTNGKPQATQLLRSIPSTCPSDAPSPNSGPASATDDLRSRSARSSRRSSVRPRAVRGRTESDDDHSSPGSNPGLSRTGSSSNLFQSHSRRASTQKPYDAENRPRRKVPQATFSMTPMASGKSSPVGNKMELEEGDDGESPMSTPSMNMPALHMPTNVSLDNMAPTWMSTIDQVMSEEVDASPVSALSTIPLDWTSPSSLSPSVGPSQLSLTQSPIVTSLDMYLNLQSTQQPQHLHHSISSPIHQNSLDGLLPSGRQDSISSANSLGLGVDWGFSQLTCNPAPAPNPIITRLIPAEGPVHGGIEVTILGANFVPDLVCMFGDHPAMPTHFWSSNTLVCILPPSANPGPVVVSLKGISFSSGTGIQMFTYKDNRDQTLLELALQVVGMKMTGRLEDAQAVARRIVETSNGESPMSGATSPFDSSVLRAVASTIGSTNQGRVGGRFSEDTRSFEGIITKLLTLLDLTPAQVPGASRSTRAGAAISLRNKQHHTLLHLATVLGFHRLVQFLITRGIDLNATDRSGYSALHFAALYGRVSITRLLLEAGATGHTKNLVGDTALDVAQNRDDPDIQEVFMRLRPALMEQSAIPRTLPFRSASFGPGPIPGTPAHRGHTFVQDDVSYDSSSETEDHGDSDEAYDSSSEDGTLTRNQSTVSLHYLIKSETEQNQNQSVDSKPSLAPVAKEVERKPSIQKLPDVKQSNAFAGVLANSPGGWLTSLKHPFTKRGQHINHPPGIAPAGTGTGTMWEKMPGFNLPIQMPEIMAFQSITPTFPMINWYGKEEPDRKGEKRWGYRFGVPKFPPPSYSATPDVDELAVAGTSTVPTPTHIISSPNLQPQPQPTPEHSSIRLRKNGKQVDRQTRNEYAATSDAEAVDVDSDVEGELVSSKTNMGDDRMLAFFWIPVLLVVSIYAVYWYGPQMWQYLLAVMEECRELIQRTN